MEKYTCDVCGYEYDPAKGDEPQVPAGTPFDKVDNSWLCPVCGAGKDQFNPS